MAYRVVVLDLDGTYLNSNKEVSPRNLAAVMSCYQKGIKIIIATARPPRIVNRFIPDPLLKVASFIYYNGAQIICPHTATELHESIPSAVTAEIIEYCSEYHADLALTMEVQDEWYSLTQLDYMAALHETANPIVKTMDELKRYEATKILLSGAFEGTPLFDVFHQRANILYTDNNELIQIMPINASKEQAVMKLCGVYNCSMDAVIVFGDDYNDLGLFQRCGYAVAMGNAISEIKAVADEITASNDQDGVAVVLERIMTGGR